MALREHGPAVDDWFARRTVDGADPDPAELAERASGVRVAAVLPARNEEATVGSMVTSLRRGLRDRWGLLDEVIVVDSHSTDGTARAAVETGARVVPCALDPADGKGGAIHSGLNATDADVVVFLDADVDSFHDGYVTRLLAPLIDDPTLIVAKAFYDRPFRPGASRTADDGVSGEHRPNGGGRVTELVARPLIGLRAPDLSGFAQPLAGEYAVRRGALGALRLVSGYGVDLGLLLSVGRAHGMETMCQVDLGHRSHRHHDLDALGRMALQVRAAFDLTLGDVESVTDLHTTFQRDADDRLVRRTERVTTRLLAPPTH